MQGMGSKQIRNNDLEPIGVVKHNAPLNTRKCELQYLNFFVEDMTVNQIAENMFSQVGSEGNQFLLLKDITDQYKDDSVINKNNGFLTSKPGNLSAKKINIGWTLQME